MKHRRSLKSLISSRVPKSFLLRYRAWNAQRTTDEPELRLLSTLAHDGGFIDVGANMGTWSAPAARLFRQVYAFEPNEQLATLLRSTLPTNVSVYSVALSDHQGFGQLNVPRVNNEEITTRASLESDANTGLPVISHEVAITTLDSLSLCDIDVIKIDVEGHESSVLKGASSTIARERPVMIVEIEERHHPESSAIIFEWVMSHGYKCTFIHAGQLHPFQPYMLSELQPRSLVPQIGAGKHANYVNNFIFVPQEHPGLSL